MGAGFVLYGQLEKWPSMRRMASLLRSAGLTTYVGSYSIRVSDCEHFSFEEYGGDLGEPQIEADADTLDRLLQDAQLVSNVLTRAGIRHSFEIYASGESELAGYVHHEWPLAAEGEQTS